MAIRPLEKDVPRNRCKKWEIEIYLGRDEKGKKIRDWVYFEGTARQAQLKDAELKLEAKKKQQKNSGAMTFAEYFDYWLKKIAPAMEKSTLRTYTSHVKTLKAIIGDLIVSDETKCRQLQERLDAAEKLKKLQPKSIRGIIGTLKDAIHYAQRWDMITRDIGAGLVMPKVPRKRYETYTRSQLVNKYLPALKKYKHGLFVRLLAVCGCRTEEVAALTLHDIDLKKGTLKITKAADVARREVKQSGETKEWASVRTIELDAETLNMLAEHVKKLHKGKVASLNSLVFPADDGRTLSYHSVEKTAKRAAKAAGLPYISPHKLRHSVARIMDEEGKSATQIAEMLGHADGTVSEQIYTLGQRRGKSILK